MSNQLNINTNSSRLDEKIPIMNDALKREIISTVLKKEIIASAKKAREKKFELNYELLHELKEKGHTCVRILETIPPRIAWCHKEICIKNQN